MPKTLNALIRYKTINSCLYGGRRKWSIEELIDACSAALADSRGRYDRISERTIRDDIRVMRSDILGFNAPIGQDKGLYYYSDPQYSIFTLVITDPDLATKILKFLLRLKKEIKHPELESILDILRKLAVKPVAVPVTTEKMISQKSYLWIDKPTELNADIEIAKAFTIQGQASEFLDEESMAPIQEPVFSWRDVFEKILS